MLYFGRISVSEGIDVNKASESKECIICHHHYFLDKGCKFQTEVLTTFCSVDYRHIIKGISKSEAVNVLQNVDFSEKSGTL